MSFFHSGFILLFCTLFSSAHASSHDSELDARLPVSSAVSLLYAEDFQDKLINISEQIILKALNSLQSDPNSYTLVAEQTEFCMYSNNKVGGIRFMAEPKVFGSYSAADSGVNQDVSGGDMLRFYNKNSASGLPYFLIVKPNHRATGRGLIGEYTRFTVGGSVKPQGSSLPHLQAGVWGEVDHYDITSNRASSQGFSGCPGVALTIEIAVMNRDLVSVPSGDYVTGFGINIDTVD